MAHMQIWRVQAKHAELCDLDREVRPFEPRWGGSPPPPPPPPGLMPRWRGLAVTFHRGKVYVWTNE